jgi:16S rRNA G966 N2-methylase RsmD
MKNVCITISESTTMKYTISLVLAMSVTATLLAQVSMAKETTRLTDTVLLNEVEVIAFKTSWTFVDPPYEKSIVSKELKAGDTTKVCNRKCKKCMRQQKREARKLKH